MTFIPTPHLRVHHRGLWTFVDNDYAAPMPSDLESLFKLGVRESATSWRFTKPVRDIETMIYDYMVLRGEVLCSLIGQPRQNYTRWYLEKIALREKCLARYVIVSDVHKRAAYRCANMHPDVSYWDSFTHLEAMDTELNREPLFQDHEFDRIKKSSGLKVGDLVRTKIIPKGVRAIPVLAHTLGVIREDAGIYWIVEFPLPVEDADGVTWLPNTKNTISIGYTSEELCIEEAHV